MPVLARTLEKSSENPSQHACRTSRATDRFRKIASLSFQATKIFPRDLQAAFGGLLGGSWTILGALGRLLVRSWALLGRSWALLDCSCGGLGTLLAALGTLFGALGTLLDPPGRSWLDFGASEGRFWSLLGSIWDPPANDLSPHQRARQQ